MARASDLGKLARPNRLSFEQIRYIMREERTKLISSPGSGFSAWWDSVGSGMRPEEGQDVEEHAKRVAIESWRAATSIPLNRHSGDDESPEAIVNKARLDTSC